MKPDRLAAAVWTCALLLSVVGVSVAALRATHISDAATLLDPARTTALNALGIVDPRLDQRPSEIRRFDERFAAHPRLALAHVILGGVFLAFAPLQFWPRVRNRYRALHRWSGRALIGALLVSTASALYFGLRVPFGGVPEAIAIAAVAALVVTALGRAYLAIRRGDVQRHREWMLRAFALAAGIATIRLVDLVVDPVITPFGSSPATTLVVSIWLGWILTAGAAELWIVRMRTLNPEP